MNIILKIKYFIKILNNEIDSIYSKKYIKNIKE